jgi:ethanolamine permease
MFLTYCIDPGYPLVLYHFVAPLNSGFSQGFHMNDRMATILSYFPLLATVSIYVFGFSKQLKALGTSKLFPAFFGWTFPNTNIPYVSLLVGSLFGYILLMIAYSRNDLTIGSEVPKVLYLTAYMGSYLTFVIVLISFIIFRVKYYNLKRGFKSPFGIAGAIYGLCGMLLLLIVLMRYSDMQEYIEVKILCTFIGIMSLYYFFYARHRQSFSEEEQKVLFVVSLMQSKFLFFALVLLVINDS